MMVGGHVLFKILRLNSFYRSVKESFSLQLSFYLIALACLTPILPEFTIPLIDFGQQYFEAGLFLFIKFLIVRLVLFIIVKSLTLGCISLWLLPNLLTCRLGKKPHLPIIHIMFMTRGCKHDLVTWPRPNAPIFHTYSQTNYEIGYQ